MKIDPPNLEWRPRLLEEGAPGTAAELQRLTSGGHVSFVHDTLQAQLDELLETREPSRKLGAEELEQLRAGWLALAGASGITWVYYPWSKRLVRVLPRAEFAELRTSRNRNKITIAEQERLRGLRLGVVGLSVGLSTAVTLAMEEVGGEYVLADFDQLSLSNMNRVRAGVHDIGVNKAVLAARGIFEINPFAHVEVFLEGVRDATLERFLREPRPLDMVFEECDDLYLKIRLRERARELGIPVLMETSDRGMIDVERFDLEPTRPLMHGLVGGYDAEALRSLSTYDKVPIVLRILGDHAMSPRFAASLVEIEASLETWPQLASAIALGGALNTDTARRIALGQLRESGRFYVDLEEHIRDGRQTQVEAVSDTGRSLLEPALPELPRPAASGLGAEQVRSLAAYGTLAPSGGNCQPWRLEWDGERLRCTLDRERARNFLDFQDSASCVAFGALAENVALAAEQMGLFTRVTIFPEPGVLEVVCDLRFEPRQGPPADDRLFRQITARVTNRKLQRRVPLPAEVRAALEQTAADSGARLQLLDDPARLERAAALLGRGDRLRLLSQTLHAEMMRELRWSPEDAARTRDGLDVRSLELDPTDLAGMKISSRWPIMELVREVGGGRNLEKLARKWVAGSAAVGLITMRGTRREDFFAAGRAFQRVWLEATARGFVMHPMTALLYLFARLERGDSADLAHLDLDELRALRRAHRELFDVPSGHGEAMLFRLAKADPPSVRALRLPTERVLTFKS